MPIDSSSTRIPIKEGLFRMPSNQEGGHLIGSRCRSCGEVFFPQQTACTHCFKQDMEVVPLSTRGKLHSYTAIRQRPPDYKGEAMPLLVGEIDLPEMVRVTTPLTKCVIEELVIDMEMELVLEPLYRDDAGREVISFKFKPLSR